jgi:hypothetical protein
MNTGDYEDSMTNLRYTFTLDKVSCIKEVWYVHVMFAFLTIASGVFCFITRVVKKYKSMHVIFGRSYIVCMLWCMGTSLVIHNTGLPVAVLLSFLWVLGGLTFGWIFIKKHQSIMEHEASDLCKRQIEQEIKELNTKENWEENGILRIIQQHGITKTMKALKIKLEKKKSIWQRMYSYKAAHGILMFVSFINIAGRIFGVDLDKEFSCHTFPYYKQVDIPMLNITSKQLTRVPVHDENYNKLPWAHSLWFWAAEFSIGAIAGAHVLGWIYSALAYLIAPCLVCEGEVDNIKLTMTSNMERNFLNNIRIQQKQHLNLR